MGHEEIDMSFFREMNKKSPDDEIWVTDFNDRAALSFREEVMQVAKSDPNRPIIVYINSYGGLVDALASMIETMDEVPNPIVTVAHGTAMSCGAILLSHGDIRYCGPHSRVMIHEVSGGAVGNVHDVGSDASEMVRLNTHFMGLLAKNCKIKGGYENLRQIIKTKDGRDSYLDAEQAKRFGIVDIVGVPKLNSATGYQLDVVKAQPIKLIKNAKSSKRTKSKKSESKRK